MILHRQFGFKSYLKDMFHCPEGVMRYLCLMYKVYLIPVGDHKTKDNVQGVVAKFPELKTFYTENHQVSLVYSWDHLQFS